jgi:hypothetical protein
MKTDVDSHAVIDKLKARLGEAVVQNASLEALVESLVGQLAEAEARIAELEQPPRSLADS